MEAAVVIGKWFGHETRRVYEALRETPITTAVMLAGGGAPTKDLVILRSLLDQPAAAVAAIVKMVGQLR